MVLQQPHSSFRSPKQKPEASRIVATTGAIALNVVVLLLMLVPASRLVMPQKAAPTITWSLPDVKPLPPPPPPPPPPKDPVQTRAHVDPTPVSVQPPVDLQITNPVFDPQPAVFTVPETQPAPAAQPAVVASAGPVTGVSLEYLKAPSPTYPREAILAHLEGTVLLRILVDVDGKPIEVRIEHSSGQRSLDEAARRYVLRYWLFKPAMRDGQAVQAIGLVPIDFKLG